MKAVIGFAWSCICGAVLVCIGIFCGAFVIEQFRSFEEQALGIFLFRVVALSFISLGAIALGIERIFNYDFGAFNKVLRPDDWELEKLSGSPKDLESELGPDEITDSDGNPSTNKPSD